MRREYFAQENRNISARPVALASFYGVPVLLSEDGGSVTGAGPISEIAFRVLLVLHCACEFVCSLLLPGWEGAGFPFRVTKVLDVDGFNATWGRM